MDLEGIDAATAELEPMNGWVVLRQIPIEEAKTAGGVILPAKAQENHQRGRVVCVSGQDLDYRPEAYKGGASEEWQGGALANGDVVVYPHDSALPLLYRGEHLLAVPAACLIVRLKGA